MTWKNGEKLEKMINKVEDELYKVPMEKRNIGWCDLTDMIIEVRYKLQKQR